MKNPILQMDGFDKISAGVIVVLIITTLALISGHMDAANLDSSVKQRAAVADHPAMNDEIENKVKMIKNFVETNNLEKAEALTQEVLQKYPYDGEPHMIMGDIFMRRLQPLKAVPEYKEAVDLNPDYLDKKTPLFQGKKLKVAVSEALAEIEKGRQLNSQSESMNMYKKDVYYLQRRIAGSCS